VPDENASETCSPDVCRDCITTSCCHETTPPLTKKRMRTIKAYLKNHSKATEAVFGRSDFSYPSTREDGFCIFNDPKTKMCLIHDVKPETCRAGPVTFDINFRTKKVEWFLKKAELCPLAGKLFENPEKLREHLNGAKEAVLQFMCEVDADDLQAILKRDEPLTFKIDEDPLPKAVSTELGIE
jgi:Fe-S-cluster containining protein